MHSKILKYICPICGYNELDEPAYDEFGYSSHNICSCCGIEFGYEDAKKSHEELRKKWINEGCIWWSTSLKPPNWNPKKQLENITKKLSTKS